MSNQKQHLSPKIHSSQFEESSSLDFLNQSDENLNTRKNQNSNRQFEPRKVIITNNRHEKYVNNQSHDGTYLYKPGAELPSLHRFSNQLIRIIIASEYIKSDNSQLLSRNIYGTETYSSNSDAVCMLIHCGFVNINNFSNRRYEGVQLICKVIKPKKNYGGTNKNNLLSRSIKGYNGNALKPESCRNLVSLGSIQALEKYASNMHIPIGKNRVKPKPKNLQTINPIPQTHIVFNQHNEPAYKYSLFNLADKGYQKNQFLISKLQTLVLYLQTEDKQKYQLVKSKKEIIQSMKNNFSIVTVLAELLIAISSITK